MYERSAVVLEKYFSNIFGFGDKINLKTNYKNFKDLIEEFQKYQVISEKEEKIINEFDDSANQIRKIQQEQKKLYKSNIKFEEERNQLFDNLDESPDIIEKKLQKIENVITDNVYTTFNTNYITLVMVMLLSLSFIALYFVQIHKPLNGIIKATKEYGKGNLAYKIDVKNDIDEIGRLSASLNYMASKLDESDQFQQKFLSNISHDFRSPLTSIKGYLEAIADGTIPPEMAKKYIDIVLFETDRLTKLTSNILTLNELDPKTVRLELSVFDVNSIIKHTIETFEGTCKKKRIQFQLTFSAETCSVKANKSKIGQVIYNLVDNAIKFSHENSVIYISVREKGEKAYISVKDNGSGISKESLDKIWDRFYKSDASRGRDKKGSGLGLSITKEILQAHNETIDVVSTIGVGTEFIFTLALEK